MRLPNTIKTQFLLLLLIFLTLSQIGTAQKIDKSYTINDTLYHSTQKIEPESFKAVLLNDIIFDQINQIVTQRGHGPLKRKDILTKAAIDQAIYMAKNKKATVVQEKNKLKKTTADRLMYYRGTKHGIERVANEDVVKRKEKLSYAQVADDIVFNWFSNYRESEPFENGKYHYIGVGTHLNQEQNEVYASVVLGSYMTFNNGTAHLTELPAPISDKSYRLKEKSYSICKKTDRLENIHEWQQKLTVRGNSIYFITDEDRDVKRLLRDKKDGLAVDILQKEQYPCSELTLVDHNKNYHGILTRPLYKKRFFKKNEVKDERSDSIKTYMGELPDGINENYELNLVIIQDKHVCKLVTPGFIIPITGKYKNNLKLIADTVTINSKFSYQPTADSLNIQLKVPFENKKYTYKQHDIDSFIDILNEPKFYIYDLKITAYSSIEGSDEFNRMLQHKRAESIVNALGERKTDDINVTIETKYNWHDFKADIVETPYSSFASMTMDTVREIIRQKQLKKELEHILEKHRYAQIDMSIVYDLEGENEKKFVISQFNKAIANNDKILALSIQKYILKQILNKRYPSEVLQKLTIPINHELSGILMNSVFAQYKAGDMPLNRFKKMVDTLNTLDADNEYINYNYLALKVQHQPIESKYDADITQSQIERLYYTSLQKRTVDRLNIAHQLKTIAFADSVLRDDDIIEKSLERLKEVVDFEREPIGNSKKLAGLYVNQGNYETAKEIIERWIRHPEAGEGLIFTYLSLCSLNEFYMHSQHFNYAIKRARELNKERFCKLFKGDNFSLKVFENYVVREEYCNYCNH